MLKASKGMLFARPVWEPARLNALRFSPVNPRLKMILACLGPLFLYKNLWKMPRSKKGYLIGIFHSSFGGTETQYRQDSPGFIKSLKSLCLRLSVETGVVSFAVFGLPMEGLAVWGLSGMILYPFIFMLPVLYICGRLSSFRLSLPVSIYLFVVTQHFLLEGTSDDFMTWMTRSLPVNILILFVLHAMLRRRAILPRAHAI